MPSAGASRPPEAEAGASGDDRPNRLRRGLGLACTLLGFLVLGYLQLGKETAPHEAAHHQQQATAAPEPRPLAPEAEPQQVPPSPPAPTLSSAAASKTWPPQAEAAMHKIHGKYATGDLVGALRLADEASADTSLGAGFQQWLHEQMPQLLVGAGWALLRTGNCDEALPLLQRGHALKPGKDSTKGLGLCSYKLRLMDHAQTHLENYLQEQPDDQQIRMIYSDTLESAGHFDEALAVLEKLQGELCGTPDEHKPGSDQGSCTHLRDRLQGMRAKHAHAKVQQLEVSENFRLSYRSGEHDDYVTTTMSELESALEEYREHWGMRQPAAPIEVALYSQGEFKNVVAGGPEWAEGIFDGRIRVPIRASAPSAHSLAILRLVLRHELVHALLAGMSDHRRLPSWFEEGLAQKLSCRPHCGAFGFGASRGNLLPEGDFAAPYISLNSVKAGRAYRQSLYLVETLVLRKGEEGLRRLIFNIKPNSEISSDALLAQLNLSFSTLRQDAANLWQRGYPLGPRP